MRFTYIAYLSQAYVQESKSSRGYALQKLKFSHALVVTCAAGVKT